MFDCRSVRFVAVKTDELLVRKSRKKTTLGGEGVVATEKSLAF